MRNLHLIGAFAALAAAGCDSNGIGRTPAPDMPPPQQAVDFTVFVQDQFATTADDLDPVDVDATDFAFTNADDPTAYDTLLP